MKFSSFSLSAALLLPIGGAKVVCNNAPLGGTIDDNVEVPEDGSCVLSGAIVTGDVKAKKDSSLTMLGAIAEKNVILDDRATAFFTVTSTVGGKVDIKKEATATIISSSVKKVEAKEGSVLELISATVDDDVKADKVLSMLVQQSEIGKKVEVKNIQGRFEMTNTTVGGDFKLTESDSTEEAIVAEFEVVGDIEISKNTFLDLLVNDGIIGSDNGESNVKIEDNTITKDADEALTVSGLLGNLKDLTVRKNDVTGPTARVNIGGNRANGKIKIEDNDSFRTQTGQPSVVLVNGNCAANEIKVKKNKGGSLTCNGNKEFNPDCGSVSGFPPISAENNNFLSIGGQCVESNNRRLRH